MSQLMQQILGADWDRLPPALQAHYRDEGSRDVGHLDIAFHVWLLPLLWAMRLLGALVHRRGQAVETTVLKHAEGGRQHWRRTLRYGDGRVLRFDSHRVASGPGRLIEFVNPVLGLELVPSVVGEQLHYRGTRMVAKLGPWLLTVPEWLVLGHTTIVEQAVGARHYAMDFRMTHPLFGELFRYAGRFEADV
ncbi:DUF4166 domain-containing protein [Pseudorhodoferax soli]|uniref:Uncharacterized protein DUF4166 n=1 Tax=Pseudorhodoferax soli TaxID=545864 RepID=A0A368XUI3_9BURK|nr:DUF4166 domain-containing protein [Pseudorhodoferax soli]RCW71612.1 uncharacterized protein DUF4166 [Pseudorhodoferax soli]